MRNAEKGQLIEFRTLNSTLGSTVISWNDTLRTKDDFEYHIRSRRPVELHGRWWLRNGGHGSISGAR